MLQISCLYIVPSWKKSWVPPTFRKSCTRSLMRSPTSMDEWEMISDSVFCSCLWNHNDFLVVYCGDYTYNGEYDGDYSDYDKNFIMIILIIVVIMMIIMMIMVILWMGRPSCTSWWLLVNWRLWNTVNNQ